MLFFFPFGPVLYFLVYYLFGRNAQSGVDANREEENFLLNADNAERVFYGISKVVRTAVNRDPQDRIALTATLHQALFITSP